MNEALCGRKSPGAGGLAANPISAAREGSFALKRSDFFECARPDGLPHRPLFSASRQSAGNFSLPSRIQFRGQRRSFAGNVRILRMYRCRAAVVVNMTYDEFRRTA